MAMTSAPLNDLGKNLAMNPAHPPHLCADDAPFDRVNTDRSSPWPRYRVLADGSAQALIVTDDSAHGASVITDDGALVVDFQPISAQQLTSLTGDDALTFPSPAAVAYLPVAASAARSYRIATGDRLPAADATNDDSAGELMSLLTHPDAPRAGIDGIDMWPPRSAESVPAPSNRAHRLRLDRAILGRRATLHLHLNPAPSEPSDADDAASSHQNPVVEVPVVLLLDGDDWMHMHDATGTFATAVSRSMLAPHALAYVPAPPDRDARTREMTDPATGAALSSAILDAVDTELARLHRRRGHTVVVAQSLAAMPAVRAAMNAPTGHGIDAVVAQSPSFWWPAPTVGDPMDGRPGGDVHAEIIRRDGGDSLRDIEFWFTVGIDEAPMHRHIDAVATALRDHGAPVHSRVVPGGHDHAMWRLAMLADVAAALAAHPHERSDPQAPSAS